MDVYVLSSTDYNGVGFVYVEGVFSSYSTMLQYVCDCFTTLDGENIEYLDTFQTYNNHHFKGNFLDEHGDECKLAYREYGVIGEHSVKTDRIIFK